MANNQDVIALMNENHALKEALRQIKTVASRALPPMTNVEMRTKLVTAIRPVLIDHDDMNLQDEADLENVIDALTRVIGAWAQETVDEAFRRIAPTIERLVIDAKTPGTHTDNARKFLRDLGYPDPFVESP